LSTSTYRVVAQFEESGHAKTGALNGLQKLFGNDHVRVHVLNVQFRGNSLSVCPTRGVEKEEEIKT